MVPTIVWCLNLLDLMLQMLLNCTAKMTDFLPSLQKYSLSRRCKGSISSRSTILGIGVRPVHLGHFSIILTLLIDLYTRNLALVVSDLDSLNEEDFIARLGKPEIGAVTRSDGGPLAHNVPAQIVRPAFFRKRDILLSCPSVKIIDFGEAFFNENAPSTLHTPLPVRAPEDVFGDRLDRRVDLWSAGCLVNTH